MARTTKWRALDSQSPIWQRVGIAITASSFNLRSDAPEGQKAISYQPKTEKFLVIKGRANFGFRHILTNETHDIVVVGGEGRVVETIPGWTHNVSNIGNEELVVMVWANEIFNRDRPDTNPMTVSFK